MQPKKLFIGDAWGPVAQHVIHSPIDIPKARADFDAVTRQLVEALVIAPVVSIRVDGANVVAPLLAQMLGPKVFLDLLDEGAVEFVLWSGSIVQAVEPENVPLLLGSTGRRPGLMSDPEASTTEGYRAVDLELNMRRRLTRATIAVTRLTEEGAPQSAVSMAFESIKRGDLAAHGFPPDRPSDQRMTREEAVRLQRIATDIFDASVVFEGNVAVQGPDATWQATCSAIDSLRPPNDMWSAVDKVYLAEAVPSVQTLLERGALQYGDVLRLRRHRSTKEFRDWLWRQEAHEPSDVAANYLKVMNKRLAVSERSWFKLARVTGISVAGTAAGGAVGGLLGAAAGGAIGWGISLLDEFWLQKIVQQPNPRHFATDVLRVEDANQRMHQ